MARIRTVKPEFFTSADIVKLSPLARLFYVALWCEADREGRLGWNIETFKYRYFPAEKCDLEEVASELLSAQLVTLYEVEGRKYADIPTFKTHQVINNREAESVIPARVKVASKRVPGEGRKEGKEGNTPADESAFDRFWEAYPKKKSKEDALKAWTKLNPDEHLVEDILQAVLRAKTSAEWLKEGGQFIPYPGTWLRGKRWLDDGGPEGPAEKDWE